MYRTFRLYVANFLLIAFSIGYLFSFFFKEKAPNHDNFVVRNLKDIRIEPLQYVTEREPKEKIVWAMQGGEEWVFTYPYNSSHWQLLKDRTTIGKTVTLYIGSPDMYFMNPVRLKINDQIVFGEENKENGLLIIGFLVFTLLLTVYNVRAYLKDKNKKRIKDLENTEKSDLIVPSE